MEQLLVWVSNINNYLSDYVLIFLLAGTGIYFSIRTRWVQVRCFNEGWRNAFARHAAPDKNGRKLSPFQALVTAVAAQVGTGNIIGASGAILIGGPGSIFWMWLIAFFGMATVYSEAVLAQETRVKDADGTLHGGPVYYIKRAFPNRFGSFLAAFFAVATVIALGFMGAMVQANSIGETCHNAFGLPAWTVGGIIAVLAGCVFVGGVSRLARVSEKIVPFMALLYIAGGIIILTLRWKQIPETFMCIFKYAFLPEALIGGSIGYALKTAISQGVKRGLFSNEAGMGSTPHAHAVADVASPHIQGTVAMIGVFIDTAIVLTMTALIVISTIYVSGPLAGATGATYQEMLAASGLNQNNLVQYAVASVSSTLCGNIFVAVCLLFFAFSTILSWNYFGRINVHYLFGSKAVVVYAVLAAGFVFIGTVVKSDLVWALQDMFNQLMVLPNIIALWALASPAVKSARRK